MKTPTKMTQKIQKPYYPPLAISVHGIRTRGAWQKEFAAVLSGTSTRVESFDFGTYGLLSFLMPGVNARKVNQFYEWYSGAVARSPEVDLDRYDRRPSVVAHSLGSWIVGQAMLKFEDIRFDKIILAGSILETDFDWCTLFARDQVSQVVNECGKDDPWPKISSFFVAKTGTAGRDGFKWFSSAVRNKPYGFGHSDAVLRDHIRSHWVPVLNEMPSPLALVHGRSIEDGQLFSDRLDHAGTVVDHNAYGNIEHYEDIEIPRGLSLKWIRINPDIYTFLIDRKSNIPAGYLNAMPLNDAWYRRIRNEKVNDDDVPAEAILPFDGPEKTLKVYLMSIAIDEEYRRWGDGFMQHAYVQLITGFLDKLTHYAHNHGTRVSHFLATAWTAEGARICESLLMTEIGRNEFDKPIYEVALDSLRNSTQSHLTHALRQLLRVYSQLGPA